MTTQYEQNEKSAETNRTNIALELQKDFEREVCLVTPEDAFACLVFHFLRGRKRLLISKRLY